MSYRESVEKLTTDLVTPLVMENQLELVDVEYVKEGSNWYLRVFIDKEGGVTIDDCELTSRALDKKLDEVDPIKDPYILEVSSPGLDRPLKKEKDFLRSIGKSVEIKLYKAVDGQKEFVGVLEAYENKKVVLLIDDKQVEYELKDIAMIRLAVIF